MNMIEAVRLRDNITQNIDNLSKEYCDIDDILNQLNRIINWNMSDSNIVKWYSNNIDSIKQINLTLDDIGT